MEVKDFSQKIVTAAEKNSRGRYIEKEKYLSGFTGLATGFVSGLTTFQFWGLPIYHVSGLLSYLCGWIPDNLTTYRATKLFSDKRFREYGLENNYFEGHFLLPKHPSWKHLFFNKKVLLDIAVAISSTVIPVLGYGYGIGVSWISESNWALGNELKKALEIGDDVKKMIEDGSTKDDVMAYLESLYKNDFNNR